MALIGRNTVTGNFVKCSTLTPDGSTTTFTLTNATTGDNVYPGSQNSLLVSVSGVIQAPGDAFTINNNTIASKVSRGLAKNNDNEWVSACAPDMPCIEFNKLWKNQ